MSGAIELARGAVPVLGWTEGVPVEADAVRQLRNLASLPFIHEHVAVMPDVHVGIGATVGSVVPMRGAIVPAAVGVDIGCGMIAQRTSLSASDLPDNLKPLRGLIERVVPHGRTAGGGRGDKGAWEEIPRPAATAWTALKPRFDEIVDKHPGIGRGNTFNQLGTLGTGNHFIEVCLDEEDRVWVMLHSGSRGVGNRIGTYFIERARASMQAELRNLPDRDLAWFNEPSKNFQDYIEAVGWAQDFARLNRELMMAAVIEAMRAKLRTFTLEDRAVNCHHNYVARETHYGEEVWVTRKGAVRAGAGELGIIPGSMGARSYIVCGKGHAASFCSCSHGAGRAMSRTEAKKRFTLDDHVAATRGVECRKDNDVIDETPMAYKKIEAVMAAQAELVDVVHELRQVLCVKG